MTWKNVASTRVYIVYVICYAILNTIYKYQYQAIILWTDHVDRYSERSRAWNNGKFHPFSSVFFFNVSAQTGNLQRHQGTSFSTDAFVTWEKYIFPQENGVGIASTRPVSVWSKNFTIPFLETGCFLGRVIKIFDCPEKNDIKVCFFCPGNCWISPISYFNTAKLKKSILISA